MNVVSLFNGMNTGRTERPFSPNGMARAIGASALEQQPSTTS